MEERHLQYGKVVEVVQAMLLRVVEAMLQRHRTLAKVGPAADAPVVRGVQRRPLRMYRLKYAEANIDDRTIYPDIAAVQGRLRLRHRPRLLTALHTFWSQLQVSTTQVTHDKEAGVTWLGRRRRGRGHLVR